VLLVSVNPQAKVIPRSLIASLTATAVGALWGIYWMPLRGLDAAAAAGAWTTFFVLVPACALLAPFAWRARGRIKTGSRAALASTALGGASFTLYSDGLLDGQVAVVILLFYLTPIWSTLIAKFWQGEAVAPRRYAAIVLGLAGIVLVLRGSYGGVPLPHALGDWLGLASGILWAIAATGMHAHSRTGPFESNFVFCFGALITALILALILGLDAPAQSAPGAVGAALGWTLLIGVLWWAASLTAFVWATQILEPTRVGLLLMSEVVVGASSAAVFGRHAFGALMIAGTVLVIVSGLLETLPGRRAG
jgi:drug/metabolite transporter (DMT)-like permease